MRNNGLERRIGAETIVRISLEDDGMKNIIASAYRRLLNIYNCNISAIIRDLRIPRQSFYNKLNKYGIDLKAIRRR